MQKKTFSKLKNEEKKKAILYITYAIGCKMSIYSETCLKRPLKNMQNKGLKDKWKLNAGQVYCRMLSWSILQYVWSALSDNRSSKPIFCPLFEWPLKTGFTILIHLKHHASFFCEHQSGYWAVVVWLGLLDSLRPSQHLFSHVGTYIPGLNQP